MTFNGRFLKLATAITVAAAITGCNQDEAYIQPGKVKNVIMMIGDGMGPQQVGMLQEYAKFAPGASYQGNATAMEKFTDKGVIGFSATGPFGSIVVDSACSASQLATGVASGSEMIGLNAEGDPVETVLEAAKAMGKATGLVSDTRLTHATPASFAAHQPHRSYENQIAVEMLENGVDVMLSGGLRYWIPQAVNSDAAVKAAVTTQINEPTVRVKSKRKDDRNLLTEAAAAGYQLAFNQDQLNATENDQKVLGLFAYSGMLDGIQYTKTKEDENRAQPTLKEMTIKALDILSQDPDGFFLMVEGGQIDWAAHNNDAGTMLHEMLKFDEAVEAVYEWVEGRKDTLVVITADHETGGFGFSYSRKDLPEATSLPGSAFAGVDYKPNFNFGDYAILDKLYLQKKSLMDMYEDAVSAAGGENALTAEGLMNEINASSEFKVTLADAAAIMEHEYNEFYVADHSYLSATEFPKIDDFEEFYVYGEEVHYDAIGRKLAADQNIVWGTGTHTHTPVQVIAWGPVNLIWNYAHIMRHTDVGALTMKAVKNEL